MDDNKIETKMDSWNPQQYHMFSKERNQPFYDLMNLIRAQKNMVIVDLGCGTGHLTKILHETHNANKTLGIDSSDAMLKESASIKNSKLDFQLMKIEDFSPQENFDLIFSNAALQWLPNHPQLLSNLAKHLTMHGQLAIQMPSNFDYPTHIIAKELGNRPPFKEALSGGKLPAVLRPEEYSQILYKLGFKKQIVRLQVYPILLDSSEAVVDWVKGSLLTYYQSRLSPDAYEAFLNIYREKVVEALGIVRPFFMPFKRLLIWAQL